MGYTTIVRSLGKVVILILGAGSLTGCETVANGNGDQVGASAGQNAPSINGGNGSGDFSNFGGGSLAPFACGSRTVNTIPANTFVESEHWQRSMDGTPRDSPLAKVFFPNKYCDEFLEDSATDSEERGQRSYLEVGPGGAIIPSCDGFPNLPNYTEYCGVLFGSDSYVVRDGCLEIITDTDEVLSSLGIDREEFLPGLLDAEFEVPEPLCPNFQIPLSRTGIPWVVDEGQEFICLEIEDQKDCRDCSVSGGVWSDSIEYISTVTALGTLSGISNEYFQISCDETEETYEIRAGDQITLTYTERRVIRTSASPEDFDIRELPDFPSFPNIPDLPDLSEIGDLFDPSILFPTSE